MDFWELTKLLLRRWYVAVPLLLLTIGSAAWTWFYVSPDYKTVAYVQLIPPTPPVPASPNQPAEQLRNPWLTLGLESLNSVASVTTVNATFLEDLVARGLSDNITITQGYPNPIAQIEVIGGSEEQTLATADEVTARYIAIVKKLQEERRVSSNSMISTYKLDTGPSLEETGGKVKRAVLAVGAVGLLLTAALTVGFDAVLRRRRRPRAQLNGFGAAVEGAVPATRRTSLFADEQEYGDAPIPAPGMASGSRPPSSTAARPAPGGRAARANQSARSASPQSPQSAQSRSSRSNSYQIPTYTMPADTPSLPPATPAEDSADSTPARADEELPMPPDATIVLPLSHTPRRRKNNDSPGTGS